MGFRPLLQGKIFSAACVLFLATAIINLIPECGRAISVSAAGETGVAVLPAGMRWGMPEAECVGMLLASGYSKIRPDTEEPSPDKALRRFALSKGIVNVNFSRHAGSAAENLSIGFYDDALYKVSVGYEDFGRGFKEKILGEIAAGMGSAPETVRGLNSDIEIYMWTRGATSAQFAYRELPGLDLRFAQVEYANAPVAAELKRLGFR